MTPMPPPFPFRTRRALAVLVAGLVLMAAAVGCSRDEPILVVNGWSLPRADFVDELRQIADNTGYREARAQNGQSFTVFKDGSTTDFAPEFVTEFLNERITFQLAEAEVRKRGLTVSDADRTKAIDIIAAGLAPGATASGTPGVGPVAAPGTTPPAEPAAAAPPGSVAPDTAQGSSPPGTDVGRSVLDAFGSYREVLITGVANLQVLQNNLTAQVSTDDQLRQLYEQVKDKYATQACVRHLLIKAGDGQLDAKTGQPVTPTDAEYASALATITPLKVQIDAGADFATVAAASSDDTATKDQGGDLGCTPKGQYEKSFDDAVWTQPVGHIGAPVRSTYGYHLILVSDRRTKSFDETKDTLRAAVANQAQQALQTWLTQASRDATVIVDPAYGTWNPATGVLDPPGGTAKVTLVPNDTGTVPGSGPDAGTGGGSSGGAGAGAPTSLVPEVPKAGG